MRFKNKVVVITGASSGIGEASAIEFAKNGGNIVLVGRKKSKLIEVEKKLSKYKISTLCCECDVSQKTQVKVLSKQVFDKFGRIDILVNNAGFAIYGPVLDQSIEEIESQMNTKYSPASLSAKTVAKAVLRAANSSRLEIIVPSVVRGAVWAKHTFPFIVNPIIGSAIRKRLSSKNSYSSSSG